MELTLAQFGLMVLLVIISVLFGMVVGIVKCMTILFDEDDEEEGNREV